MGEPIRLGIVGLGWWGARLAKAAADSGACTVTACYARSADGRERFASDHGCQPAESFDALVSAEDVDAVVLATPHSTHREQIEHAAERGKHVFVEKPLTLTVEDGTAAIRAAEDAKVVLQVGHNRRRQTANRRIKEMVDTGELGMLHLLQGHICVPKDQVPRPGWRSDPAESPVGGMTALGVHLIDTFRYLAGPITRVHATSKQLWAAGRLDDVTVVTMEFARGPLGYLGTSIVLPRSTVTTVMGTGGSAWNEDDGGHLYLQRLDEDARHELPVEHVDTIADELAEFARCIREVDRPETSGAEGIEVVAVLEAIRESDRSGEVVDVRPIRATF